MQGVSNDKPLWKKVCSGREEVVQEDRNYFLITSSGQMGTFWLASQLNKHPEIYCSHSYDQPAWGASGEPLRGEEGERQRKVIKQNMPTLTLEDFFSHNAAVTNKKYVGNVHAYNIDRVLPMLKKERLDNIKLVNLIRHPITRINSFVKCMKNEWFDDGYYDHLTFIPQIYRDHGRRLVTECFGQHRLSEFDDSLDKQFFVSAAILERGTAYQFKTALDNKVPVIKYEDITSSKDTMKKLVECIGNNGLIENHKWFDEGITFKKLNSHTKSTVENTVKSIVGGWVSWKKDIYQYLIQDKVFELYADGYYESVKL